MRAGIVLIDFHREGVIMRYLSILVFSFIVLTSCTEEPRSSTQAIETEPITTHQEVPEPPPPPPPAGVICYTTQDSWDNDDTPLISLITTDGSGYWNLNTVANAQLSWIGQVAWKPDASEIAFIARRGSTESIFAVRTDDSGCVKLTQDEHTKKDLVWSPTGEYLAYTQIESVGTFDLAYSICVMKADGSESRFVTNRGDHVSEPCWSENGQTIFYKNSDYEIDAVGLDGSSVTISSELTASAYYESRNIVIDFDYNLPGETLESGGELSIRTPYWAHSQTYLDYPPRFYGPAIRTPDGESAILICRMGSDEYLCLVDLFTYEPIIIEPPAVERSWNETDWPCYWINNSELLFFGKRQNKYGFCILDITTGQLSWVFNHEDDERILDMSSWDYLPLN